MILENNPLPYTFLECLCQGGTFLLKQFIDVLTLVFNIFLNSYVNCKEARRLQFSTRSNTFQGSKSSVWTPLFFQEKITLGAHATLLSTAVVRTE